jgi:hypothetical protein
MLSFFPMSTGPLFCSGAVMDVLMQQRTPLKYHLSWSERVTTMWRYCLR